MDDEVDVLDEAVAGFLRRFDGIAGRWRESTPCAQWSVLDLVEHVVAGNTLAVHLLAGGTAAAAPPPPRAPDSATVQQRLEHGSAVQRAAFTRAGTLGRVCDHPAGAVTGHELLRYRAADIAVHTWDLARALALDEALAPAVVDSAVHHYLPWVASMPGSPQFRTPDEAPAPEAPAQRRLLHALGRGWGDLPS